MLGPTGNLGIRWPQPTFQHSPSAVLGGRVARGSSREMAVLRPAFASRLGVRFAVLAAVALALPFPFSVLPGLHVVADQYAALWASILPRLTPTFGSLDPALVQLGVSVAAAFVVALGWAVLHRSRVAFGHAATAVLRYWVAGALLTQGIGWWFTGDVGSQALGAATCVAAGWLFWRRTATLGALLATVLLGTVAVHALDRGQVVGMASWKVLGAASVLVLVEAPRLFSALLGYATRARFPQNTLSTRWLAARWIAKAYLIGAIAFTQLSMYVTWS